MQLEEAVREQGGRGICLEELLVLLVFLDVATRLVLLVKFLSLFERIFGVARSSERASFLVQVLEFAAGCSHHAGKELVPLHKLFFHGVMFGVIEGECGFVLTPRPLLRSPLLFLIIHAEALFRLLHLSQILLNVLLKHVRTKLEVTERLVLVREEHVEVQNVVGALDLVEVKVLTTESVKLIGVVEAQLRLKVSLKIDLVVQNARLVHHFYQKLSLAVVSCTPNEIVEQKVVHDFGLIIL